VKRIGEIWRALSKEQRATFAQEFWDAVGGDDSLRDSEAAVRAALQRKFRLRPNVAARLPVVRCVEYLANSAALDAEAAEALLKTAHVYRRSAMLARFCDLLEVPHENGAIAAEADVDLGLDRDRLSAAMETMRDEFAADDLELYWDVLIALTPDRWALLAELRDHPEVEVVREPPVEVEEPAPRVAEAAPPALEFATETPLDRLITRAIVEAGSGITGAASQDDIEQIVDEFARLNVARHRSYFHLGFADLLLGDGARAELDSENSSRRAWYSSGAIHGLMRERNFEGVTELAEQFRDSIRLLGSGRHPASASCVPLLAQAFVGADRAPELGLILTPQGLALGEPRTAAFGHLLRFVTGHLRLGRVEDAAPLLDLLMSAMSFRGHAGLPVDEDLAREIHRRNAHRLRLQRQWDRADAAIRELLETGADSREGMLRADLGMLACHKCGLAELTLPASPGPRAAFAESLTPGEAHFRASAECSGPGGHGEYALGVLLLARDEREQALPYFERAVASMRRNPDVYRQLNLLARAKVYLGICLAATENVERVDQALEVLKEGLGVLPDEVPDLVAEALSTLAILRSRPTSQLLEELPPSMRHTLLDVAKTAELLSRVPTLRASLEKRARNTARDPRERFNDYRALLRAARKAGSEELALRALDGLELLSEMDALRSDFLGVVNDDALTGGIWEESERRLALVRLHREAGEIAAAVSLLEREAHHALTGDTGDASRQADDLIGLVRELGSEPTPELLSRLAAAQSEDSEAPAEPGPCKARVLFIGGNEIQARYDDRLRANLRAAHPQLELVIQHPGWNSNWGKQMNAWKQEFELADAVVLMPLVRTILGRMVRRRCSEREIPWFPCTGRGLASMERAVLAAACWARDGSGS